jgi:hypothetical protein
MNQTYDVASYSDAELFDILDLSSPSDRELEAKILHMIWRYESFGEPGNHLVRFFEDIYDRFFEEPQSQVEGFAMMSGDTKSTEISPTNPTQNISSQSVSKVMDNITDNTAISAEDKISYNFPLDYTKDQLNPLLKSTTKRIISIDSQFRPTTEKVSQLATDFTFNLSTPLKDVVNLKMNSAQIPYTWYTINNNFGSNFIYLKGNVPGINDGNYDISFTVPSGNYNAGALVDKLNENINATKSRTDISLGNTNISYDIANSKATFNWDIKNTYNEYYYELEFSNITPPNDKTSIPAFLGFNYKTYYPFRVYSDLSIDVSIGNTYTVNNLNNTMTINYGNTNILIQLTEGIYNITELTNELNSKLASSDNLYASKITKVLITDTALVGFGMSHFEMDIRLNRSKIRIVADTNIVITFPSASPNIWFGLNSAFGFKSNTIELGKWISESSVVNAQISINDNPYILFDCIDNSYSSPLNDISMSIPTYSYTLDTYISAINTGIKSAINTEFSFGTTKFEITSNQRLQITVDMARTMSLSDYTLDLTGTIFNDVFNFPMLLDLSGQTVFDSSFGTVGTYTLTNSLIKLNAKIGSASDGVSYDLSSNGFTYSNLTTLQNGINQYFISFVDADGDKVLANSKLTLELIPGVNRALARLEMRFNKQLRGNKYKLKFVDNSRDALWSVSDATNSWAYNLKIDREELAIVSDFSYNPIAGKYTIVFTEKIIVDTIVMNADNNTITIRPISTDGYNGIYSPDLANTRVIEFPIRIQGYTRNEIFNILELAFEDKSKSVLLSGSIIDVFVDGVTGYTQLRLNINRTYSAKDYKLVFYDPFSFVTCSVGNSSVRNTTWDATLGWILGFRKQTEYELSDGTSLIGDTVVSVNIYSYFMIVLEDYNLNRMTDGIVTTTQQTNDIALPSYANRTMIQCDPGTGGRTISTSVLTNSGRKNLTKNQITSASASLTTSGTKKYTAGSFTKDVLAIIPLKLTGLPNNSMYVINGSDLAGQERSYFGPVNLQRMTVKLVNDKGETVDLNGADWSMTILCEQMYNQK